jgi:hypothetical protein
MQLCLWEHVTVMKPTAVVVSFTLLLTDVIKWRNEILNLLFGLAEQTHKAPNQDSWRKQ